MIEGYSICICDGCGFTFFGFSLFVVGRWHALGEILKAKPHEKVHKKQLL